MELDPFELGLQGLGLPELGQRSIDLPSEALRVNKDLRTQVDLLFQTLKGPALFYPVCTVDAMHRRKIMVIKVPIVRTAVFFERFLVVVPNE